jgi:hypothetical protein
LREDTALPALGITSGVWQDVRYAIRLLRREAGAGLLTACLAAESLSKSLYGISPHDALSFIAARVFGRIATSEFPNGRLKPDTTYE